MRLVGMRPIVLLAIWAACSSPAGTSDVDGPDADTGVDAAAPDAPESCPAALFGTFAMPQLSSRSNVCVPSATCTFTKTTGCSAQVTCEYELAGTQSGEVTCVPTPAGWAASMTAGARRHDWVYQSGMAYRVVGSVADHHLCTFTDGGTAPVFPTRGAGACPDLTRAFKLRQTSPHLCSKTLRCGVLQSEADPCIVDTFCTFPTGGSIEVEDITVTRAGASGVIVGDTTEDPMYPERYELHLLGDFTTGAGAATGIQTDYYFNAPASPTCSWMPNGPF
jgi:hypothetical protein